MVMQDLIFVTGNPFKFEIAKKSLDALGIEITQEKLETPEIQSTDVREVASYSARWAADKLGKPVVVADAGYYISALNGFPGPFVKYINKWLTAADILKLMQGKSDRSAEITICLAYCQPDSQPVAFIVNVPGTIAETAGAEVLGKSVMDQLFIYIGFDRPDSEIPREEIIKFWAQREDYWHQLAAYLSTRDKK